MRSAGAATSSSARGEEEEGRLHAQEEEEKGRTTKREATEQHIEDVSAYLGACFSPRTPIAGAILRLRRGAGGQRVKAGVPCLTQNLSSGSVKRAVLYDLQSPAPGSWRRALQPQGSNALGLLTSQCAQAERRATSRHSATGQPANPCPCTRALRFPRRCLS